MCVGEWVEALRGGDVVYETNPYATTLVTLSTRQLVIRLYLSVYSKRRT